jgi:hypothetical protein
MKDWRWRSIWMLLLCLALGCDRFTPEYRALRQPTAIETPSVNVPLSVRQKNWLGSGGDGSCVHASLSSMLHWQNQFELAKWWRSQYSGGEWSDQLRRRLDAAKIPYAFTERANIKLLDDAHNSRRGAILWWKPSHCCTFVGWAESQGKVYACILDNNRTQAFEFVERSQFHKQWAGYGGFALTTLYDPPSAPIWKSYEIVEESWQW